uniref:F-box domain-containing protein n=1 Tax=Trichuris muris TaxID=70415 RepID=A0A5S6QYA0_TRIMR
MANLGRIGCKATVSGSCSSENKGAATAKTETPNGSCSFVDKINAFRGWWKEFNDEEKERFAREILSCCGSTLTKSLAVQVDSWVGSYPCAAHRSTDPFALLPAHAIVKVLSLLDPVSLCHCCLVSKRWMSVVNENNPWKSLCTDSQLYRLSSKQAEEKHAKKFVNSDGEIRWKMVLSERYRLWRNWMKGRCVVRTFEGHTEGISCVQFDDNYIVSGSSDKMIKVWDIRTNNHLAVMTLSGHSHTVRSLLKHPSELSCVFSFSVWDLSMNRSWSSIACRATMLGHASTVRCLQMDDEKIVSGSYDTTLKVWDLVSSQCFETLRGHAAAVLCLQFDHEKIVSGSADDTIRMWDLRTCTCVMTMQKAHDAAVTCLQFNDRQIVSGSLDCTIKFWDVRTGRWLNTLDWVKHEGHTGVVRCLQADSWRIVSGADDKTMKVWNLHTGERIVTLRSHSDGVTCLSFSDFRIVSGSYDKTVKLWDFSMG